MKSFIFFISLIFTFYSQAKESVDLKRDWALNIFLPSLQFRFLDGVDQSRSLKAGYSLKLAAQLNDLYTGGLEYNIYDERSGNSSLSVTRDFSEYNFILGYNLFRYVHSSGSQIILSGLGYLGQNKSVIKTQLLSTTATDQSTSEVSYGAGLSTQFKIRMIILELATRMMTSKSYEPQTVSITDLRFGFQMSL